MVRGAHSQPATATEQKGRGVRPDAGPAPTPCPDAGPAPTPFALKRRVASIASASVTRSDLDRSSEGEATSQQIAKDSAPCTHVKMHGSERRDDGDAARRKRKASKSRGGFCSETEFTAELE